jgi:hypothetical protein
VLEQTFPDFIKSRGNLSTSLFLITHAASQLGDDLIYPIAEGAREIVVHWQEDGLRDIPSGMVCGSGFAALWRPIRRCPVQSRRIRREHHCGLGRRCAADPGQRRPRPRPGLEDSLVCPRNGEGAAAIPPCDRNGVTICQSGNSSSTRSASGYRWQTRSRSSRPVTWTAGSTLRLTRGGRAKEWWQ